MSEPRPLFDRHPGVRNLMRWLRPNPRLPQDQAYIAAQFYRMAELLLEHTFDGPEQT